MKDLVPFANSISGMSSVHPGRPLVAKDGNVTYSDARVYNLKEKLILLGFPNGEIWCRNKPEYKVPTWASDNFINTVLAESFLPRLAAVLAETIPNRTAHPDEKLEDYPQMVKLGNNSIEHYPVVGDELRNYGISRNSSLRNRPCIYKK